MSRAPIAAACCAIAAAVSITPAVAAEQDPRAQWFDGYEIEYLDAYEKAHAEGFDVGRNIVDDGLADGSTPPQWRVEGSTDRLERWLNPPPAPAPEPVAEAPAPAAPAPVASSGGCPASMAPESGSAGYSAYNASSGATGCYQIIPSTAAAYGCDLSTPAGQDTCAARICEGQGNAAWASSGAAPC